MSKSKRIQQDVPPKPRRHMLRKDIFAPVAAVAGFFLVTVGVRLGLGALLRALLAAWNLRPDTVARAPGWARTLYGWQGSIVTLIVDAAAMLYAVGVCKARLPRPDIKKAASHWAAGVALALVSAAVFLITDSLRLQWPLNRPRLTPGLLPLWALILLTTLAEELFTKGVVYDRVKRRWGAVWAVIASTALFFLTNGGYSGTWISAVNVALMGAYCALCHDRFGLWAPVGFRWGWSFAAMFLLGQGGGDRAVYRLYGVSETLLTGGDAGLVYGLWVTAALALVVGIMMRRSR